MDDVPFLKHTIMVHGVNEMQIKGGHKDVIC